MLLYRFLRNSNGRVAPMLALVALPLFGFVGAAVDFGRAASTRVALQSALDATALMRSKGAATVNNAALQTKANDYFKALFTRKEATNLQIAATYNTTAGSQVVVTTSSNVKTNFMGMMGFSTLRVAVDSQVKWGNTKMRVALALDTTGSMVSDGKMDALKIATKSLLTQLRSAAANNGDVYVSIIPFSKDVNVGKSNYNQSWVDFKDHGSWDG